MSNTGKQNAILESWEASLATAQDRPAIYSASGMALRTFAEIEEEARSIQNREELARVLEGSVVGMQLGNSPSAPALLIALWRKGCIPLPLDRSLANPALDATLDACGASVLIQEQNGHSCFTLRCSSPQAPPPPGTEFLKVTSGTTGTPRAICFTSAQLKADCTAVCDTMGIMASDLNYGVIPWSHSYGFSNLVTPLLCRAVPVVATEDRLPRAILAGLRESQATVFPGLPIFFQKLLEIGHAPLPRLRLCVSAGAPLAQRTATGFPERFGLKVHSFYGSSECGGIAYDATDSPTAEGYVGTPMRGVDLDFESDGEASRIRIRSAAVGIGYWPTPEPAVLADGEFSPGDLIRRAPEGLYLAGRVSDFINVAGKKLNPATVESVIRKLPGIREAVVFGIPHPIRGEETIACIVGNATPSELATQCTSELASWQIPRDFWLVESLPVNERGKLNRQVLASAYLARRSTDARQQ